MGSESGKVDNVSSDTPYCATMRHLTFRTLASVSYVALALALAGCADSTAPVNQRMIDVLLDFCSDQTPVWFAFQNQNQQWQRVTPNAEGTFAFTAADRLTIAYVTQVGSDYTTQILNVGNTELEKVSGVACLEESGTKQLNGTVAGLGTSQVAQVSMFVSSTYVTPQQSSFALTQLASRPLDLVATRATVAGSNQDFDRIIIRRNLNLVSNATIPTLDFNSIEAAAPATVVGAVSGLTSNETAFMALNFFSQLATTHFLQYASPLFNGSVSMETVPSQLLNTGDYHDVFVIATTSAGDVRGVENFFGAPANQSLALSTVLAPPTVGPVATTPNVRLRAVVARQPQYNSAVTVLYDQQHNQFSSSEVAVTTTQGYADVGTWDMSIPDLSGVSGWQTAWGLASGGGTVSWTVTAYGGRPELLFGASPVLPETIQYASKSSTFAAAQAYGGCRSGGISIGRRSRRCV